VYIQYTVSSRVISSYSFKTKMTSHMDHDYFTQKKQKLHIY